MGTNKAKKAEKKVAADKKKVDFEKAKAKAVAKKESAKIVKEDAETEAAKKLLKVSKDRVTLNSQNTSPLNAAQKMAKAKDVSAMKRAQVGLSAIRQRKGYATYRIKESSSKVPEAKLRQSIHYASVKSAQFRAATNVARVREAGEKSIEKTLRN